MEYTMAGRMHLLRLKISMCAALTPLQSVFANVIQAENRGTADCLRCLEQRDRLLAGRLERAAEEVYTRT